MKFLYPLFGILLISTALSAQNGEAWNQKIDESLLIKTEGGEEASFIIFLKEQAKVSTAKNLATKDQKAQFVFDQLKRTAENSQKGIAAVLEEKNVDFRPLFIVNAIQAKGNFELIKQLALRSDVAQIQDNPYVKFDGPVDRVSSGARATEWGINSLKADIVWSMGFRGQGVTVGGQDTGYEWGHPALQSKYRGYISQDSADHNYNWHDAIHEFNPLNDTEENPCGLDSQEPCDDHNHGTHTMGTMVGEDGDNEIGVAPAADWCACRNMERGYGSPFTYLECFQWFIAPTNLNDQHPDPSKSPHVIANSWSCPPIEGCNPSNFQLMNLAVNNLKLAGTVVVVSAGNKGAQGCHTINTPAAIFEGSFTVGAIKQNDTIATFSSRGYVTVDSSGRMKPNVVAPGKGVRSSIRNGEYASYSGTSMAGPHVAGVVALMISANPELAGQVEVIEGILESTSIPKLADEDCGESLGSDVPNHTYGFGSVDALAAVEAAIALIVPSSLESVEQPNIKLFPNPGKDLFHFLILNLGGDLSLEIYDLNGRQISAQNFKSSGRTELDVNLTAEAPGFYIYRLKAGDQNWQGKLIKQ